MAESYPMLIWSLLVVACGGSTVGCAQLNGGQVADTRVPALPSGATAPPGTGGIMLPPGDVEVAIRTEFAGIEKTGTAAAYALFAERHPDHPLGREARRRAALLRSASSTSPSGT